jgi:glycine/D-amino acid oxidase-like deaminating enzyme
MFPADVLIIGGGIRGLVLLNDLTRQGYACVLVTAADLGSGQTLHSHGLLNSGTALLTGQLQDPLRAALSFARHRGLQLYGEDSWYALVSPAAFQQLRAGWDGSNYEYRELCRADLPPGFREGDLFRQRTPTHVIGLKGYNFPKRQLVRLLSETQIQRVVRGDIAAFRRSVEQGAVRIDSVDIRMQATGEVLAISPQAVIAAAGTGTKRLLKSIVASPSGQLARVTYTRTHMICIRAPRGVLPATSIMSLPHGLISGQRRNDNQHFVHSASRS